MSSGQFPIAVGSRPIPVPSPAVTIPPSSSLARAYQGGSSAGNYVVHDRNAGGSRNLSVSRLDAPPEIAIPTFLFPRARAPSSSTIHSRGPALMTLENRSFRSLAHCHSSLSHAPLIARYLSLRAFLFSARRLRQASMREVSDRFYLLS
jgi:hypothetical protein